MEKQTTPKAIYVGTDGTVEIWDLSNSYETTKKAVNHEGHNLFDVVRCEQVDVWVNDEGILMNLDRNNVLLDLLHGLGQMDNRTYLFTPPSLFGNALITGGTDNEGETLGVPESLLKRLKTLGRTAESR